MENDHSKKSIIGKHAFLEFQCHSCSFSKEPSALSTNVFKLFHFILIQGADSLYDVSDSISIGSGHGGSTSSLVAVHGGTPELLVALCYQSLTGRLTVEILKASNLRMPAMQRAPGKTAHVIVTIVILLTSLRSGSFN